MLSWFEVPGSGECDIHKGGIAGQEADRGCGPARPQVSLKYDDQAEKALGNDEVFSLIVAERYPDGLEGFSKYSLQGPKL
jgi:hypothetical protein